MHVSTFLHSAFCILHSALSIIHWVWLSSVANSWPTIAQLAIMGFGFDDDATTRAHWAVGLLRATLRCGFGWGSVSPAGARCEASPPRPPLHEGGRGGRRDPSRLGVVEIAGRFCGGAWHYRDLVRSCASSVSDVDLGSLKERACVRAHRKTRPLVSRTVSNSSRLSRRKGSAPKSFCVCVEVSSAQGTKLHVSALRGHGYMAT